LFDIILFDIILDLFDKTSWGSRSSDGRTTSGFVHHNCDWLYEIKEKCLRFGLHDSHASNFVKEYDHRYHFKKLKEIFVFPKTPNEDCDGEMTVVSTKKRSANVSWRKFQKRPEVEIPKYLKNSVTYVCAFRNKDPPLRRERSVVPPALRDFDMDFRIEIIF